MDKLRLLFSKGKSNQGSYYLLPCHMLKAVWSTLQKVQQTQFSEIKYSISCGSFLSNRIYCLDHGPATIKPKSPPFPALWAVVMNDLCIGPFEIFRT